ncbi:YadA family autotransporter adhesin [Neisseria chenwenguii]|uniref:Calcium-binding protein n=1 Tax=Neisseria chenwenguii TaxID=1853278 RepID=A0A220S1Q7_9NEIS|nr:YadA-like family protein [Neisseria chenwenguii]ASK27419.1 calcium-binding protein [Neisseria chenwenguii]ROV56909.1 calcium-binding protein [Neisseria chenwenguii]
MNRKTHTTQQGVASKKLVAVLAAVGVMTTAAFAADLNLSKYVKLTGGSALGDATATGINATAIGNKAAANGQGAYAAGANSTATGNAALSSGSYSNANGTAAAAFGNWAQATANQTTAVGQHAKATNSSATAVGSASNASGISSAAFGTAATASGAVSTALGQGAIASGANSTATGTKARAAGLASVANGSGALASGNYAVATGSASQATGAASVAAGLQSKATGGQAVAIGRNAQASEENSVALGSNSTTAAAVGTNSATVNGVSYGGFAGTNPVATVSVGSSGSERTVTNVAAGRITADSTDAINGSQLYQVANGLQQQIINNNGDINGLKERVDDMDKDLRAGIAGATAMAFLQRPNEAGKSQVSAAVGGYRGQQAVAVGYARNSDNNKWSIKTGVGVDTQKHVNWGGSVGYQW